MSHSSKSKAKGISSSSFFDLKAELSKQEAEFAKAKAAGKSTAIVGGVKRPDKKPTVWARQNKGVHSRATRDVELEEVSKPTLESARSALERKAKIYEKLRKGKTGGLNDAQFDALLVDFDDPNGRNSKYYESDSEDEDESLAVPQRAAENDPIVEYEDEFGRIRTAPRSEVPRNLLVNRENEIDEDEDLVIRNPINHLPIYTPSAERVAEIAKAHAEENNPLNMHYDASRENRAKGAGFYQFSGDAETRKAQMDELKQSREETAKIRQKLGAEDIQPGEVEGMKDESAKAGKSKAMEKRKRELEERRQMLEAKRRKTKPVGDGAQGGSTPSEPATSSFAPPPPSSMVPPPPPSDPFSALEAQSQVSAPRRQKVVDPFAVLEGATQTTSNAKGKAKASNPVPNEADSFLAQLEQEFLGSKIKKKT